MQQTSVYIVVLYLQEQEAWDRQGFIYLKNTSKTSTFRGKALHLDVSSQLLDKPAFARNIEVSLVFSGSFSIRSFLLLLSLAHTAQDFIYRKYIFYHQNDLEPLKYNETLNDCLTRVFIYFSDSLQHFCAPSWDVRMTCSEEQPYFFLHLSLSSVVLDVAIL